MIEEDLSHCLQIMEDWGVQNNEDDRKTNFIYKCNTLNEVLYCVNKYKAPLQYALHRWFNYITSKNTEYIFCEFGAIKEPNIYNHDIDIYINSIPFDVKLTTYPKALNHRPYNLTTREGKNEMIRWFYTNQSKGKRKQYINRLYVVVDGSNPLQLKADTYKIRTQVQKYMKYTNQYGLNIVEIPTDNNTTLVYSDLIFIKE